MPRPFDRSVGTYTGSGVAQTITLGYRPTLLFIYNDTDNDTLVFYMDGMADGIAPNIAAATGEVAANGVTLTARGFTVGTDVSVNESAKTFRYCAFV